MIGSSSDLILPGQAGALSVRELTSGAGEQPVVVLVQGATLSGQTAFDLSYGDYSLMQALAVQGFSSVTFAVRGYGRSDAPADPLSVDTEAGLADLDTVVTWALERSGRKVHLLGWSWGGRIAARYAEDHAASVDRLVLLNPALGGGPRVPFNGREPWFHNAPDNLRARLPEAWTDAAVREAFVETAMRDDSRSASGIRVENARGSQPANPVSISRPTMLVCGGDAEERDELTGADTYGGFVDKLACSEKAMISIAGSDHYGHFQRTRVAYHNVIGAFFKGYGV